MIRALHDCLLFFQRDLHVASSYRSPFILELVEALFGAATFYYVARFVDSPQLRESLPQGISYFAFSLVGFAFFDYLHAAVDSFDRSLEEARDTGTLEPLLVTQVSLPVVLVGSVMYPFTLTTLRVAVYLGWGSLLFGFPLRAANWFSVLVVLVATMLSFSGLGIFSISVLPHWLQIIAHLNPVTYALDAMRAALLEGASVVAIAQPLLILLLFAVLLLPTSMLAFSWALQRTKITGTLSHR
jgi:ABC-2 type transport system permease protein